MVASDSFLHKREYAKKRGVSIAPEACRNVGKVAVAAIVLGGVVAVKGILNSVEFKERNDDVVAQPVGELEVPRKMEQQCLEFRKMHELFLAALKMRDIGGADKSFNHLVAYYNSEIRDNIDKYAGLWLIADEMQEAFIEYADELKKSGHLKSTTKIYRRGTNMLSGHEKAGKRIRVEEASTLLAMARSSDDVREVMRLLDIANNMLPDARGDGLTVSKMNMCGMLACATLLRMEPDTPDREQIEKEYVWESYKVLKEYSSKEALLNAQSAYIEGGGREFDKALAMLRTPDTNRLLHAVELHGGGDISSAIEIYNRFGKDHPLGFLAAGLSGIAKEQLKFRKEENLPAGRDIAGR